LIINFIPWRKWKKNEKGRASHMLEASSVYSAAVSYPQTAIFIAISRTMKVKKRLTEWVQFSTQRYIERKKEEVLLLSILHGMNLKKGGGRLWSTNVTCQITINCRRYSCVCMVEWYTWSVPQDR
jgi:hypothetical protein